jgi:enoyl-CoA hydratase/carnithine racemase
MLGPAAGRDLTIMAEELVGRKHEEDDVELLVLQHPPVNTLSTGVLTALETRLKELPARTRAVVLTGDGAYFSAGADLKELATIGLDRAPELVRSGQALFSRLAEFPAPVVAALNGLAVGGGLELALACDLRVAADSAKFGAPEVSFGLMPAYGGTQRLSRLVGASRAKELILTGDLITATEALRIGLLNRVVPAGQVVRAARDLAHATAQRAPRAVVASKAAIDGGLAVTLDEGLKLEASLFERSVLGSEDLGEGIQAFLERRPPMFRGR